MSRPKRSDETSKLNLLVGLRSKRKAFNLASKGGMSVGRLFEMLVEAEAKRLKIERGTT